MSLKLTPRLACAAAYISGGRLADIGTDHAYLPAYLAANGKIDFAIASDINEGPLKKASETVSENGVSDIVKLKRCDGLCGIEEYHPDSIAILGMGGELIAKIISDADWVKTSDIKLILQPMTKRDCLRSYLIHNGFKIEDESTVTDGGRIYQIIYAYYTGKNCDYDRAELLCGRQNLERRDSLTLEYIKQLKEIYERTVDGKKNSGSADCSYELEVINELERYIG